MTPHDPVRGDQVKMQGSVQGSDKSLLANFHEDLEAAPFAEKLAKKSDPVWTLESDNTRIPPEYVTFPMSLEFEPTVGDPKKRKR